MQKRCKILLVEDDRDVARILKCSFKEEGYSFSWARNAEDGLRLVHRRPPEVILADIMLPGMNGYEFCRQVRRESQIPIIFLTAKQSEVDRVSGLRLGADDYVTKPFSYRELSARIQAVLRRSRDIDGEHPKDGAVELGGMKLNFHRHEFYIGDNAISLTPKEFELLRLLTEHDGEVFSRESLLERVWGMDRSYNLDTRTVDQHISRLRSKLGPERRRIVTLSHFGYKLDAT